MGVTELVYKGCLKIALKSWRVGALVEYTSRGILQREPDFVPHEGFAEWEIIPGCWLQVGEGTPTERSGPFRLGVTDIEAERDRIVNELGVEPFEVYSREEVPVKWGTFF
ncbi:MAG: hypothetical protein K6T81_16875 [Alicyclobacillus macrosporangiidus]|nr:hypothetical protein [Alicyclobacillus macrosporangiidus]